MRESFAASAPVGYQLFVPNPPPMSIEMTLTFVSGTRNMPANSVRSPNGRCAPAHTVSLSPFHSATAARGSIGRVLMCGA